MKKSISLSVGYAILFFLFVVPLANAGPDAFLKKGTFAINPSNNRDIFLYVPGKTLLYQVQNKKEKIGSIAFPDRQRFYLNAITQDGINVLVWEEEVEMDIEDNLSRFDFYVNRRLPLCLTESSCEEIWSKFNRISDEGDGWIAIWPGAGGKFAEQTGRIQKVEIDAGGWMEGAIPAKRNNFSIEDYGYITNLRRSHPLYKFKEINIQELSTVCGQQKTTINRKEILSRIEVFGKMSANISIDPASAATKIIPKKYVKLLLNSLGLEASIGAEAFLEGNWKNENENIEESQLIYGNQNECWEVKDVYIEKRTISEIGTDSDYVPFGHILIKRVFDCQAGDKSRLNYVSFLLSFYDTKGAIVEDSFIPLALDQNTVKQEFNFESEPLPKALLSIANKMEHFAVLDYFLQKGIPKSIGNFYIKEINRSRSK